MHQKMAKPYTGPLNSSKATESATVPMLQSARSFRGVVKLEVDIGRIFVKNQTLPSAIATGRPFSSNDWSLMFSTQGGITETLFTNLLQVSDRDIATLSDLKQPDGRRMFAEGSSRTSIKYQFLCGAKLEDEDLILEVNNSGDIQVLSTEHVVGAIQWHYPKRQWDARLAVKTTEQVSDYYDAVEAITKTLSVTPSANQKTVKLSAALGNTGLYFKSVRMVREADFCCLADPDLVMSCTEVQSLGPVRERNRYSSLQRDTAALRKDGEMWWEVKLRSLKTVGQLQQNEKLCLGDLASWTAGDITQGEAVKRLQDLAADVVTHLDRIGATVSKAAVKKTTGTTTVADRSELLSRASQATSYW